MHNLIINFLTQNIQKKSKNLKNSKINKKLQNNQKSRRNNKRNEKNSKKGNFSYFFGQNLKSSCFHISLWNFEKQEIVQTAVGR
jgi:hypothetical protein